MTSCRQELNACVLWSHDIIVCMLIIANIRKPLIYLKSGRIVAIDTRSWFIIQMHKFPFPRKNRHPQMLREEYNKKENENKRCVNVFLHFATKHFQ